MASGKKTGGKKSAKPAARKPAKPVRAKSAAAKPAKIATGAKGDVVYSDLRRDALAWQLNKIR
ncbi:MAG TPA: hypothetical protein VNE71_19080 [Myxococcota bacterium]|nr:hypothetical protein [Myxococcota bacterium]